MRARVAAAALVTVSAGFAGCFTVPEDSPLLQAAAADEACSLRLGEFIKTEGNAAWGAHVEAPFSVHGSACSLFLYFDLNLHGGFFRSPTPYWFGATFTVTGAAGAVAHVFDATPDRSDESTVVLEPVNGDWLLTVDVEGPPSPTNGFGVHWWFLARGSERPE